jgi:hypothetical protein
MARQYALNNDYANLAKEINNQIGTSAEFGEMNRIQQEAIAKSVGMSAEELEKGSEYTHHNADKKFLTNWANIQ